jgi:hypothetical protein
MPSVLGTLILEGGTKPGVVSKIYVRNVTRTFAENKEVNHGGAGIQAAIFTHDHWKGDGTQSSRFFRSCPVVLENA